MSVREQKGIFGFVVLFMFLGFLWAVVSCPPPQEGELPAVFAIGVAQTLIPAFVFLWATRKLSKT